MKKLLFFILLFYGFLFILAEDNAEPVVYTRSSILQDIMPADTVLPIPEDAPMLYYWHGKKRILWTILTKQNNEIRAYSGHVTARGKRCLEDSGSNQFDTAGLFSEYKSLLSWGFDSLALQASSLKPTDGYRSSDDFVVIDS